MEVTILGKSPSWQDAGGACSGYLVEENGTRLLIDCGNGVFGKLRRYRDYAAVDTVVISHLHADHFLDLIPFSYALTYGPRRDPGVPGPALHAPAGARDTFRRVVGAWGTEDLVERAFDLREYEPDDTLAVGPLSLRFCLVPHFTRTHAIEVRSSAPGTGRFTYGADSGPSEDLCAFARDTDLLILEATLREPEREEPRGHMTAAEAGEHGRRAAARRLVLTHLSDELDAGRARADAERAFGGPVDIAREGMTYRV